MKKNINETKKDYVKQLRRLLESEVGEAEIVIAVKGIGSSIQEMAKKIGRLQNEDLPPLSDHVRETYGENTAGAFQDRTHNALQSVLDTLFDAKSIVDETVMQLASGQADSMMSTDMDNFGDDSLGGDMDDDFSDDDFGGDDDLSVDDFGGAEIDEPLGRAAKESVEAKKAKIAEMKALINKAKKLKERN